MRKQPVRLAATFAAAVLAVAGCGGDDPDTTADPDAVESPMDDEMDGEEMDGDMEEEMDGDMEEESTTDEG